MRLYIHIYIEEKRQTKSKEKNFGKTLREVFIEENLVQKLYAERTFCFLSVSGGKTLILCFSCSSVSMSSIQEKLNCGWEFDIFDDEPSDCTIGVDIFDECAE